MNCKSNQGHLYSQFWSLSYYMRRKLGLIQVFRGFAALAVVLCHLSGSTEDYFNTSYLGGFFLTGYIGVDFFFVLSGFIITYVHFKDVENGTNKVSFLKKRFIRIYPFYWIIATVYLILLILAKGKTTHLDHTLSFYAVNDWLFVIGSYLLIPMNTNPLIGVTWSLTYELLFYAVFFICILIGVQKSRYLVIIWAVLIFSRLALLPFYEIPDILIFNERIIQFLSGCLVAYLILKSYFVNRILWIVLFIFGLLLLYIAYPDSLKHPFGILVLALVMGLIVYKIVIVDIQKDNKYPDLLLLLGEASYSIYLSHVIFLSIFLRAFRMLVEMLSIQNFYALQVMISGMFLLIVFGGVLVYRYVESPVLAYFNKK